VERLMRSTGLEMGGTSVAERGTAIDSRFVCLHVSFHGARRQGSLRQPQPSRQGNVAASGLPGSIA
jgi:hypothetical protein